VHSAVTLKRFSPDLPVQVITDKQQYFRRQNLFDFVDEASEPLHPLKAKIAYLRKSRFKRTLYLDADTELRADIRDLFSELDRANLCLTRDNNCDWTVTPFRFIDQESESINTGFLLYDSSNAVHSLLKIWFELLSQQDEQDMSPGHNCDQVYFNRYLRQELLSSNRIRTKILPNSIYNVRPWCWEHLKRQGVFHRVKILHAHHLHHSPVVKFARKIGDVLGFNKT
jgi:hypothetical protein